MKKLLILTTIMAVFSSAANAKEMMSELSLTNPLYKPKEGKMYSETNLNYSKQEFYSYTFSTNVENSIEIDTQRAEEFLKFGVTDMLTTSFKLGYEIQKESRTYHGINPDEDYDSKGVTNPEFGIEYRIINNRIHKFDILHSLKLDVFEREDTTTNQVDGTISDGRHEFGLGLRYGITMDRFTLAGTSIAKYLHEVKYNMIGIGQSKSSILDKRHYLLNFKIELEYMFTKKFSTIFTSGYAYEQSRDVINKTNSTVTDRNDGGKMNSSIQINYMINDMFTLAAYYSGEHQRDSLFDIANSVNDYEYRDNMTQTLGLKTIMEF
ncbi:hypothetical protein ACFL0U_00370 [Pseudomonadota bacterium]